MAISDFGAGAIGGLRRMLADRMEAQELARRAEMDQIRMGLEQQRMDQQRRQMDMTDTLRTDAQQNLEQERGYRRASNLAENMLPGEIDEPTAGVLRTHGFGGMVRQDRLPEQPMSEAPVGAIRTMGGSRYQMARQAADERAEQAITAAALKAEADRESDEREGRIRADLARVGAGSSGGTGWTIQTVTDPATNKTSLMRVNSRTGEAQPVALPGGVQPGGMRQVRLTAGQQDDLSTMQTVNDMADTVSALGEKIGWSGVGGLGTGSAAGFMARNFGMGTGDEEQLRNYIGNIQGTIAKLRGGTSFTPNEQKLLDSYTPTINDSDLTIKNKLVSLKQFIEMKRKNTLQFAGADTGSGTADAGAGLKILSIEEVP